MFIQIHTGVEKHNDDAKHAYLSSNKWDATGDLIKTEARIECLQKYAVAKRKQINTMLLIGMEEVLRQTEPHTKKEPAQQSRHNSCIFCIAVIIVMTTLSGIARVSMFIMNGL